MSKLSDEDMHLIHSVISNHDRALRMLAEADASGCKNAAELMQNYLHNFIAAVDQCEKHNFSHESRKELSNLAERAKRLW